MKIDAGMWCLLQWNRTGERTAVSERWQSSEICHNKHTHIIVGAHTANAHMQTYSNPSPHTHTHTHTLTHSLAQDAGKASRVLNEQTLTYGHQLTDLTDLTSASPFTSQWLALQWLALQWLALQWLALQWLALQWLALKWLALQWLALQWLALQWLALQWLALKWLALQWLALQWLALQWLALQWLALKWLALQWLALQWLALQWLALQRSDSFLLLQMQITGCTTQ